METLAFHFRIRLIATGIRLVIAAGLLWVGHQLADDSQPLAQVSEVVAIH